MSSKLTRKYLVTFAKHKTKLVVTFHNNQFKRLDYQSGGMPRALYLAIGKAIPLYESEIKEHLIKLEGKIEITPLTETKKQTDFKKFTAAWFDFYQTQVGVAPRFNGVDGKALKQIMSYLQEQDPGRALDLWQIILNHWDMLDDFFKKNKDLPFINSQLNKIIQNVQRISHKAGNDPLDSLGEQKHPTCRTAFDN